MPGGATDADYLRIYQEILLPRMRESALDLVLVSAGYDIRAEDPLADMKVTAPGIREIVEGILAAGGLPILFSLEGGYHLPALAESVEIALPALLGYAPSQPGTVPAA